MALDKSLINSLRIVLPYLIIGVIYITISDKLVVSTITNPEHITNIQTYKGWAYVFLTAVLVFVMLYRLLKKLDSEMVELQNTQDLLRKSEQLFRLQYEKSVDAIFLTSSDGRIHSANPAACKMFGRSEEEMCNLGINYIVDLHDPRLSLALDERSETGRYSGELNFVRKNGTIFPGEISSSVFRDNLGKNRITLIIRDISERKLVEADLQKSEERFRKLAENAPDLIYRFDFLPNPHFVYVSPSSTLITGYTPEEFYNDPNIAPNMIVPEHRYLVQQLYNGELEFSSPINICWIRKDGAKLWVEHRIFPIKDPEGKLIAIEGVSRDITATMIANNALKESEQRFRLMFESNKIPMFLVDPNVSKFVDCNLAAEKFYGYTEYEFKNLTVSDINVLPHAEIINAMEKATEHAQSYYNFPHRLKSGEIKNVELFVTPLKFENRTLLFAIINDITARHEAEKKVLKSQEQLRALAIRLEEIRENERKNLSRELHDNLGQNLTALKMDLTWLNKRIISSNANLDSTYFEKVDSIKDLIDALVKDVRRISAEIRPTMIDSLGLLPSLEWLLVDFKKRTEIEYEFINNVKSLNINQQTSIAVFRIFQEALTNVIRHAFATKVKLILKEHEDHYTAQLIDNGKGIIEEDVNNNRTLGILGMRERALQFDGELTIKPDAIKGSVVSLKIPIERLS